ncbi:MAG: glutamate racemase [Flavobacteriales bacterium]|nr:MAG: glutamate racemase [Flavobacteriales bacterium]
MASNFPIGLFDSGIGGLSIYNEIKNSMPNESTIYIADNLNAPYGKKAESEIIQLSIKNTQKLVDLHCKLIIVACNTATTNAIEILRKKFNVPIVGIEPAIKPAMLETKSNNIGVLATEKTLSSNLFLQTSDRFSKGINIHEQIGFDLVKIIEENGINEELLIPKLREYIEPMLEKNIDHLVLGCTHYYYLMYLLKKILPNGVKILDSSRAVTKRVMNLLKDYNIDSNTSKTKNIFLCTGNDNVIKKFLSSNDKISKINL